MSWQEVVIRLLLAVLCIEAAIAVLIIGWFSFGFIRIKYEAEFHDAHKPCRGTHREEEV